MGASLRHDPHEAAARRRARRLLRADANGAMVVAAVGALRAQGAGGGGVELVWSDVGGGDGDGGGGDEDEDENGEGRRAPAASEHEPATPPRRRASFDCPREAGRGLDGGLLEAGGGERVSVSIAWEPA